MQPLDAVYLQILKNLCTDLSEPVPLDGVDPSALYRLAENTVRFRFFCHILNSSRSFLLSNSRRSRCCSPIISWNILHALLFRSSLRRRFPAFS